MEQLKSGSLVLWTGWDSRDSIWASLLIVRQHTPGRFGNSIVQTTVPSEFNPACENSPGMIFNDATKVVLNRYLLPGWNAWADKVKGLEALGVLKYRV